MLESYQELEKARFEKVKDLLHIFIKKEKEKINEMAAQIETLEAEVNKMNISEEIEKIIDIYKNTKDDQELYVFKKVETKYEKMYNGFDDYYIKGLPVEEFDPEKARRNIAQSNDTVVSEADIAILQEIREDIANCWEGKGLEKEAENNLIKILKDKKNRGLFAEAFNEYRKNGQFSLKKLGFEKLTEVLYKIMNLINQDKDTEFALNLIILAQTFYLDQNEFPSEGVKVPKTFIHSGIQKHPFWTQKETWELAITNSVKDEMNIDINSNEFTDKLDINFKNIIYGKLGAFANNMALFNIDEKDINEVILGYANKCGLPEDQINDLIVYFH